MTNRTTTILFLASCTIIVLANAGFVSQLIRYSSEHEYASHIFLVPLISVFLILQKREQIFFPAQGSKVLGLCISLASLFVLFWLKISHRGNAGALTETALLIVTLFNGLFVYFYGLQRFRKALFPLLFLYLTVPIPESLVQAAVSILQRSSAEGVALLLRLSGTPFQREGFTFIMPRIGIEIASQCSGIRSSVALFISCLLAGHLLLKTPTRKLALMLIAVPMAMFKNTIRIVTLSLLAIHMDIGYIAGGDLHRRGGIVFFVTTLMLMFPIIWCLRWSERSLAAKRPRMGSEIMIKGGK
jgi:exosortase